MKMIISRLVATSIFFTIIDQCPGQNFQPGIRGSEGESKWNQAALQSAYGMIEKTLLRKGDKWYARFSVNAAPQRRTPFGFADRLEPAPAEQPVKEGLLEVTFFDRPSVGALPTRTPTEWTGFVSLRIQQYRLYEAGRGWSQPKLVMIHLWEWEGEVRNGQLSLRSKTDEKAGTNDGGVRQFVAALFNVPPASVTCTKPDQIPDSGPPAGPNITMLLGTLRTARPQERAKAAEAIRDACKADPAAGPAAVPALVESLLNDPDTYVRAKAAEALGETGPAGRKAIEALNQAMRQNRDQDVVRAAQAAIQKIERH